MTLSRRKFMAATGAALATATTGMLFGCAPQAQDSLDDEAGSGASFDILNTYLPLGSVVTLKDSEKFGVKFMVVSRRPNVTSMANDDGTRSPLSYVYDYAAVQWPLGFVTDLTQQAQGAECLAFNREDISRIDFVGCSGGREEDAIKLLDDAYGSMDTCATVLEPLQSDIVSKFPKDTETDK